MHSSMDFSFHIFHLSVPFSDFSSIVLTLCYEQEWDMYLFLFLPTVKPLHVFYFVLLFFFLRYYCSFMPFLLPFYFLSPPVVAVVRVSIYLYFLALVVGLNFSVLLHLLSELPFLVFYWSFLNPYTY